MDSEGHITSLPPISGIIDRFLDKLSVPHDEKTHWKNYLSTLPKLDFAINLIRNVFGDNVAEISGRKHWYKLGEDGRYSKEPMKKDAEYKNYRSKTCLILTSAGAVGIDLHTKFLEDLMRCVHFLQMVDSDAWFRQIVGRFDRTSEHNQSSPHVIFWMLENMQNALWRLYSILRRVNGTDTIFSQICKDKVWPKKMTLTAADTVVKRETENHPDSKLSMLLNKYFPQNAESHDARRVPDYTKFRNFFHFLSVDNAKLFHQRLNQELEALERKQSRGESELANICHAGVFTQEHVGKGFGYDGTALPGVNVYHGQAFGKYLAFFTGETLLVALLLVRKFSKHLRKKAWGYVEPEADHPFYLDKEGKNTDAIGIQSFWNEKTGGWSVGYLTVHPTQGMFEKCVRALKEAFQQFTTDMEREIQNHTQQAPPSDSLDDFVVGDKRPAPDDFSGAPPMQRSLTPSSYPQNATLPQLPYRPPNHGQQLMQQQQIGPHNPPLLIVSGGNMFIYNRTHPMHYQTYPYASGGVPPNAPVTQEMQAYAAPFMRHVTPVANVRLPLPQSSDLQPQNIPTQQTTPLFCFRCPLGTVCTCRHSSAR
ncbi:MAG: hypothetical protein ABW189_06820 [Rickettsiales bacterium]